MTALTKNIEKVEKNGGLVLMAVKSGESIFKNAMLIVEAAAAGVKPAVAENGSRFAGIAYEDNADGATSIRVQREGSFPMKGSGFSAADLLKDVYASDDQTVTTTQALAEPTVGKIVEVLSATEVMVDLKRY